MTTNFGRSKATCRSISGKVPLPIEPKPIITIGPTKRACSGQLSVVVVVAAGHWSRSELRTCPHAPARLDLATRRVHVCTQPRGLTRDPRGLTRDETRQSLRPGRKSLGQSRI